jgi:hypothetical protein
VIRNGLVAKRRMHDFRTSKGTGPCVLSEQRFDELQACGSVRDVFAKVMKYMELLNIPNRDLNLSLVNSEYFKVVMSFSGETTYEGKPDLFVLDPAMVKHLVMPPMVCMLLEATVYSRIGNVELVSIPCGKPKDTQWKTRISKNCATI